MAVQPQTPYKEYTANGSTKSFALEFDCENQDHLVVLVDDAAPSVGSWSLSNNAVVFNTAPANGKKITIQRNTPASRSTNFQSSNNSFRPDTLNKDLDRIWLKLQELGVADMLLKIYVDRLHMEQKSYIDDQDQIIKNIISDLRNYVNQQDVALSNDIGNLRTYVNQQDNALAQSISNLRNYTDQQDNNLNSSISDLRTYVNQQDNNQKTYFENLINQQGVSLQQLDVYYNYLMRRLAQIAVDKGWEASFVVDASGKNQQEINNLLSYASYKTPRQFGGKPDDPNFDNKYALQAAFDSKEPILLDGLYYTTVSPYITREQTIHGINFEKSGIVKVGDGVANIGTVASSETTSDNYNVDAILILKGGDWTKDQAYCELLDLRNFQLTRVGATFNTSLNRHGLYAPKIARSYLANIRISNKNIGATNQEQLGVGMRIGIGWMLIFDRVEFSGIIGLRIGTFGDDFLNTGSGGGTSITMNSCWAGGCRKYAYDIYGLRYSTMNSCGADYTGGGVQGAADYVYRFRTAEITMNSCSAEQVTGKLIMVYDSSLVVANNLDFQHGIYGDGTTAALALCSGNSRFQWNGGILTRQATATNRPYSSTYSSSFEANKVLENFTFSFVKNEFPTNKDQVNVYSGTSSFEHINKDTLERRTVLFDESVQLEDKVSNGLITTRGGLLISGVKGNIGITNYNGGTWDTNYLRLGRSRVWRAIVNNAIGIYHKTDSDPTSAENGTLLNSFRGFGATFPVDPLTNIVGQHFLRTDLLKPLWFDGVTWRDALGIRHSDAKPQINGKINPTTIAEQNAVLSSIVSALTALNLVTDNRT